MERDFLGLSSKNPIVVKEEIVEDSGFGRSSGVSWLFPNKGLALSQFPSVKSEQFEKQGKNSSSHSVGRNLTVPVTEQWVKNKGVNMPTQLTIFYGGAVTVFNEITLEKAQAIITMAGKGAPKATGDRAPISPDSTNPPPAAKIDEMVKVIPSASTMISSVPQSRKASLARFLEKRKERAMGAAPYAMNKKPAAEWGALEVSAAGSSSGKEIADHAF